MNIALKSISEIDLVEIEEDIKILTPIMKKAFDEDTKMHTVEESGGPSGYDNGDSLRRFFSDNKYESYKVLKDEVSIGAVVLLINKETQENYLEMLFLDTNIVSKGVGTKVWNLVENKYPNTKVWKSETPIYSRRNHNFYVNKCGFHIVKIKRPMDGNAGSYVIEKVMN